MAPDPGPVREQLLRLKKKSRARCRSDENRQIKMSERGLYEAPGVDPILGVGSATFWARFARVKVRSLLGTFHV